MGRCVTFEAGALLLAAVVGVGLGAARAGTTAVTVDRTFVCMTTRVGGFSGIHASAYGSEHGYPAVGMVTTAGGAAETLTAVQAGPRTKEALRRRVPAESVVQAD